MAHIDCNFYSDSLKKNAHVLVFVPSVSADDYLEERLTQYTQPGCVWPTLYLLHGSYGDCMDWALRTNIERYAQEKGIAVVMPSGENSSYVTMHKGEDYLKYIGKELVEFTRNIFPLSTNREQTYLAGLSMGGYGTYRVALEYPDTFGYAASLSGALDFDALQQDVQSPHLKKMPASYRAAVFENPSCISGTCNDLSKIMQEKLEAQAHLPQLYMSCGTEDFILLANDRFYATASAMGANIRYEKFPGKHDWDYWDAHIKDVLRWLP